MSKTHLIVVGVMLANALIVAGVPAAAHDHWIRNGKYLDPVTGQHCCNEHDCKVLDDAAIEGVQRRSDGGLVVEGVTFRKGQQHKSEDGLWYRCAWRCVFTPAGS